MKNLEVTRAETPSTERSLTPAASDRNISALMEALRGSPGLPARVPLHGIARHLASQGVLAPVAPTEDEGVKSGAGAEEGSCRAE
jgi:hypothetical protein